MTPTLACSTTLRPCGSSSSTAIGVDIARDLLLSGKIWLKAFQVSLFSKLKPNKISLSAWSPIVKMAAMNCADQSCDKYQVDRQDFHRFLLHSTKYLDPRDTHCQNISSKDSSKQIRLGFLWFQCTRQE